MPETPPAEPALPADAPFVSPEDTPAAAACASSTGGEPASTPPVWIGADEVAARISPDHARRLLLEALRRGFDPAADPARAVVPAGQGHLLVMPSATSAAAGVKVASVSPDNPSRGLPRIQAVYVLLDARSLTPRALIDGVALTDLRTPATSAVAIDALAPGATGPDGAAGAGRLDEVVVIGTGPQARGHARAILAVREVGRVHLVGRDAERADACARGLRGLGLTVQSVDAADPDALERAVRAADLVVCATSAAEPVLRAEWVRDGACIVAVGSHEPDRREVDGALLRRSLVVVEDVDTALREAGDVILAIAEGHLTRDDLRTLAEVARGDVTRATDRPTVVKTVGMSWQDLVVAQALLPGD